MYKDKDKQKEANRLAMRRARAKGITKTGITRLAAPNTSDTVVIPSLSVSRSIGPEDLLKPTKNELTDKPKRGKDTEQDMTRVGCELGYSNPSKPKQDKDKPYQMTVMERLFYRPANKLKPGESNFVSLPGRACYG